MAKYFTPGTIPPGFYNVRPEGKESIEITDEQWASLISEQFAGKQIIADSNGMPTVTEIKPADNAE